MKPFRIVGVVALVLALVSLGALGWFLRPGQYEGWVHTTGTVVAHERHVRISDGDRSVTYAIVVEYATESGQRVTTTSSFRSSDPMPVGAPVEVRYPPGKPYDPSFGNETAEFTTIFFGIFALVLGILGTVFTVVGFRAGQPRTRPTEPAASAEPAEPAEPLGQWPPEEPTDDWPRLP